MRKKMHNENFGHLSLELLSDIDGVENELVNLPPLALKFLSAVVEMLSEHYDWEAGEAGFRIVIEIGPDDEPMAIGLYAEQDDEDEDDEEEEEDEEEDDEDEEEDDEDDY